MSNDNTEQDKNKLKDMKRDLLEDLDQFLIGEGEIDSARDKEKQEALEKLDFLIKQDLSYNQIFSTIKQEAQENLEEKEVEKKDDNDDKDEDENNDHEDPKKSIKIKPKKFSHVSEIDSHEVRHSSHVVNLRPAEEKKPKKKLFGFSRKQKKEDPVEHKEKIEYRFPQKERASLVQRYSSWQEAMSFEVPSVKLPDLQLKTAFSKATVFALVLAVILLPIRGLVFFGQIQKDKDQILNFGKQGIVNLQAGVISASGNSYNLAQEDFDQALTNFHSAQGILDDYNTFLLDTTSFLPVVGKPVAVSRNLLAVATNISEAAAILNQEFQNQNNPSEYLFIINQQIEETIPYLEAANQDLAKIDVNSLPENVREYFVSLKIYLPNLVKDLNHLNQIFDFLLDFLGHDTEKRYLILFQNNNELRPTGGFVGSFALFDVYQGKVINLEIPKGGTYDLEGAQKVKYRAPQALSLINPYFNIWDANWWPDFPTSAGKIADMYTRDNGSSIDGVVAINAYVLQELLEVIGPVEMEEYGVTISADNIFSVLQEEVELNYDKEANEPKAIIADLVPKVMEKLLTFAEYQKDVIRVMADMLATKDIQLYSTNPTVQSQIVNFGWAGNIENNDRDFLYVVNTNIAGGKTDNDIKQIIDHQAVVQPNGEIINTVRITRINNGGENPFAGMEGGNVSYLRLYVPLGSEFIEGIGFDVLPESYFRTATADAKDDPDIQKEEPKMIDSESRTETFTSLDKTVFANWVALKPGESQTVSFKYKLPFKLDISQPLVNNWWEELLDYDARLDNYSLLVQSQSGDHNTLLNSSVVLPDNIKVIWNNATNKDKMGISKDIISYSSDLTTDQYFGFIMAAN